jgi:nucleoside-diphosphate kinase
MPMETTLVLVKPDGVQRGLVGRIVTRFEEKGLQVVGLKMMRAGRPLLEQHYSDHKGKPFYEGLVQFMSSGPVVAMALRGLKAVEVVRKLMGKTNGAEAEPGTIRGDHGMSRSFNLIHGSDSPETARKEVGLFFQPAEIHDWPLGTLAHVYDAREEK